MLSEQTDPRTDEELLARSRNGEHACLDELSHRYRQPLCRYCASYLDDPARAEDVVQETLAKLNDPAARPAHAVRPWLYKLARNRCLDILRRQQRSPTHNRPIRTGFDAPEQAAGPGTRAAREERRELIRWIVTQMPEEYRAVLMLKYFEGFARAEMAETLGVSETAVKGRLVRASEYLEKQLRQYTWTQP